MNDCIVCAYWSDRVAEIRSRLSQFAQSCPEETRLRGLLKEHRLRRACTPKFTALTDERLVDYTQIPTQESRQTPERATMPSLTYGVDRSSGFDDDTHIARYSSLDPRGGERDQRREGGTAF